MQHLEQVKAERALIRGSPQYVKMLNEDRLALGRMMPYFHADGAVEDHDIDEELLDENGFAFNPDNY